MSDQAPRTLDYLAVAPDERPEFNLPAIMSLGAAFAGLVFMFTTFTGIWRDIFPPLHHGAGWVVLTLSICSVIWGGIGALRADRESGWYTASLIGYAAGMFVGTLSPMLFMI